MTTGGPGAIVLISSGETAAVGREALRWLASSGRAPSSIAVLETPAGFEPNAEAVTARWAKKLEGEAAGATVRQLPLRRRGTAHSPDDPDLAAPILGADLIAFGAGSPTYAVRQLRGSVAWENARAAHLLGASFLLASAGAMAASTWAMPVYEIFKVGDELGWKEGLGLFELYRLRLAVVSHWDNKEGGAELDTSRCFAGRERFEKLRALLPADAVVVGIDEHTALAMDTAAGSASVLGRGSVTLIRGGSERAVASGSTLAMSELGPFRMPDADAAVPAATADAVRRARAENTSATAVPRDVAALVASRERARASKDFATADRLRDEIAERGWALEDSTEGTRVERLRP